MGVTNVVPEAGTTLTSDSDSVTLTNAADGQSFSYDVTNGSITDTANVDVTLVNSDVITGSDGDDIIISARSNTTPIASNFIDATVRPGNTANQDNQIGFKFADSLAGLAIASITLDLRAGTDGDAYFDTTGGGSTAPSIGADTSGIASGDVTFVAPDASPTLTITLQLIRLQQVTSSGSASIQIDWVVTPVPTLVHQE